MIEPVISVVIAAYNEAAGIDACLTAAVSQRFALPFEILVIDDGSTDDTASRAERYGCKVWRNPHRGQLEAKAFGVSQSRGHIIAILDADCIAAPSWLNIIYSAFASDQLNQLSAVTRSYLYGRDIPIWGKIYNIIVHCTIIWPAIRLRHSLLFVAGGNVAFRRSALSNQNNHYNYPISGGIAATELGLRKILSRKGQIRFVPDMCVTSSARRFSGGIANFIWNYKIKSYLWPFFLEWTLTRSHSGEHHDCG